MLPWAARYSTSDGKGTSNLKREMGPGPNVLAQKSPRELGSASSWLFEIVLDPEAPRPCHMLSQSGRVTCYPGARVSHVTLLV